MKILVTGGAGFLGSHFVEFLNGKGIAPVVLDRLSTGGSIANLYGLDYRFIKGDICDPKAVRIAMQDCDTVAHLAAETAVDRSITSAKGFIRSNVMGTYTLLEWARQMGIPKFLNMSTDEVYGEATDAPSTESSILNPKSPYAASKAGADRLAYAYTQTYGFPQITARCTNILGERQDTEKLIPRFATCARNGEAMPIYGDGRNFREWIYAKDVCEALWFILNLDFEEKKGEVFNISANVEKSVLEIADLVEAHFGGAKRIFVPDRLGMVKRHRIDSGKLRSLGWKPKYDFDAMLTKTLRWYEK